MDKTTKELLFISAYCKRTECEKCDYSERVIYPDGTKYWVCRLNRKPSMWFDELTISTIKEVK